MSLNRLLMAFLFCLFVYPISAFGVEESVKDWEAICKEAEKTPIPSKDLPGPEEKKALQNCSSRDLYYGYDRPPDFVQARKCAYLEREKGDEEVFGGSSVLMMIYANERGVERNLDLAIKFACKLKMVGAIEDEYRVLHLAKMRKENWKGNNFDLCDDITSGFMQGHCADNKDRIIQAKREQELKRLIGPWNENDKKALILLQKAFDNFVNARGANEVDQTGTGRVAFVIEEESSLRKDFLSDLKKFERGELPRSTPEEFLQADRELNSVYQKIQKTKDIEYGTVTKEGIKKTQREWLKYRDAWVTFGGQKYPQVSTDAWKTWLTRNRIKMLREFIGQ